MNVYWAYQVVLMAVEMMLVAIIVFVRLAMNLVMIIILALVSYFIN